MRLSIKTKQVAGVTAIVGVAIIALSAIHMASLAQVHLQESYSRGEMLAQAIYQRTRDVVAEPGDPYLALRNDPGIRSLLESSIAYSKNVTYAAVVDPKNIAIAHSFPSQEGQSLPPQDELRPLLTQGASAQLGAIYSNQTFEIREQLLLGSEQFATIRIGVSTALIRADLQQALQRAAATAVAALAIAILVSTLLAQWILRPIHVLRSGLSRLGRGELGVTLDLAADEEFADLGRSFNTISQQLSAVRSQGPPGQSRGMLERLEDAVAMFDQSGQLLFANPAMRAVLPETALGRTAQECLSEGHPYRLLLEQTLSSRKSQGPVSTTLPSSQSAGEGDRLVVAHAIEDREGRFLGVMLMARNLEYLGRVQSTLNYSRKLAAFGRLLAGVAHEVKNPLNAMAIHLELLRQKLAGRAQDGSASVGTAHGRLAHASQGIESGSASVVVAAPAPKSDVEGILKHANVIGDEIRRLDQVIQDFLKFARPEEMKLQPIRISDMLASIVAVIEPEAQKADVAVQLDASSSVPDISGDPGMLRQALMNLSLNGLQAMPEGGRLRLACRGVSDRRVEIEIEDTGVGISPEHLERIFDLYFTTKPKGSGIGLSMVYRIVQLHDGEVEVQSVPGSGTTFRLLLPQA